MIIHEQILHQWAKAALRQAMADARVTYPELADRLTEIGLDETEPSVRNKIQRGTYSAGFLAAALAVLGVDSLRMDIFAYADRRAKLPTQKQTAAFNAKLRAGYRARLAWSKEAPETAFDAIALPDDRFRGTRKNTALLCGNCDATVFDGWSVSDAAKAFAGKPAFGQCSACSIFVEIPGSTLQVGTVQDER